MKINELVTDYKTKLQESVNTNMADIHYEICGVEGPAHNCRYFAKVTVSQKNNGVKKFAEGIGRSKKDAEQQAAKALPLYLPSRKRSYRLSDRKS